MGRAANSNPLEKVIEGKVCDHAKALGCIHYKFTSPSRRSVPDRLFIMPDAKGVFFIEFKRRGEKPTPAQTIEIAKIRAKGTRVFVVDNVDRGCALLSDLLHGVKNVVELYRDPGKETPAATMADPEFN